ncbi:hypothetical protein ABZ816_02920 [Actinosynnema sp. NPDC047251]|uniref:Tetrapyrrole biosynthesis glutamyl-tRNA reductase dimerisation domain-containing protein n=1 Tax=Saccharothrix espanaensis (strain ATCC 51144 / DSM 44229 / JCM 9112 / NBRC 15066 / NRRL 15764) TaxID=1179773 RepID=K0JYJ7_SACES|nr:hypothetical protein BN6_39170 [Saccharothrix espanaensis DSM 44229]
MTATIGRAPEVTALRARAATVVEAELARLRGRLPTVDGPLREELEATVQRVVDHLLRLPASRVEQAGGTDLADALRELFGLA